MTTPWAKRADELEATEGHYADLAAWEEWLLDEMRKQGCEDFEVKYQHLVELWSVMSKLCGEQA